MNAYLNMSGRKREREKEERERKRKMRKGREWFPWEPLESIFLF